MDSYTYATQQAGGAQRLADKLGYRIQRVHNWKYRGVPAAEVFRVADAIGVDPRWLWHMDEPEDAA